MAGRIDGRYETRYSDEVPGTDGNFKRAHRFDYSPGGYIGISEKNPNGDWGDRVLLTSSQATALIVFIESRGRATVKRAATKVRDAKRAVATVGAKRRKPTRKSATKQKASSR